jgi:hypothetical protein
LEDLPDGRFRVENTLIIFADTVDSHALSQYHWPVTRLNKVLHDIERLQSMVSLASIDVKSCPLSFFQVI